MITLPSLAALTTAALSPTGTAPAPAPRPSLADFARSNRPPTRLPEQPGEPLRPLPRGSLLDLSV